MSQRIIDVEFSKVAPAKPRVDADALFGLAEILIGLGFLSFAAYLVHLFMKTNFG